MTHRAESITAAFTTAVTGLTTTGARVVRSRVDTVEDVPALSIEMGPDDVDIESSNIQRIHRELTIRVWAFVKTNSSPDTQLNLIREEVYNAVTSDRTLGLSYVTDIMLIGDDEPEMSGDADTIMHKQRMNFVVKYRHAWSDAGA
jgi:hypothetical protein